MILLYYCNITMAIITKIDAGETITKLLLVKKNEKTPPKSTVFPVFHTLCFACKRNKIS